MRTSCSRLTSWERLLPANWMKPTGSGAGMGGGAAPVRTRLA